MCRVADHHRAAAHGLSCAQQAERIRGAPADFLEAPQSIAETLLKRCEELLVIEAQHFIHLRIGHCPYHGAATFTHGQQCDRPAVGKAFVRHIAVRLRGADVGHHRGLSVLPALHRHIELFANGRATAVCRHQQPAFERTDQPVALDFHADPVAGINKSEQPRRGDDIE